MYHWDTTHPLVARIRKAYGANVGIEHLTPEGDIVITSRKAGLSLASIERRFKLERIDDYLHRARRIRDDAAGEQVPF